MNQQQRFSRQREVPQPHSPLAPAERESSILVCLSPSPSNQKVIRSAARFARGNNRPFTALYVSSEKRTVPDPALQRNIDFAKSLGAVVETVIHRDVLGAIMEYAGEMGVTDLFIGYSGPARSTALHHLPVYRLVNTLPDVDVHIIPDSVVSLKPSGLVKRDNSRLNLFDFLKMVSIMAAATGISILFDRSRFSNSNIITIYILAVLITSVVTAEQVYGIIAAILYILLFNFLFIDPRFTLLVYDPYYMVTYLVSIIAAVITGNVSSRIKQATLQERSNAYQAQVLLNTSELLQKAEGSGQIVQITTMQLQELLGREIVFGNEPQEVPYAGNEPQEMPSVREEDSTVQDSADRKAVEWTWQHNRKAGWGTKHFPEALYQYLSVRTGTRKYGVIGVKGGRKALDPFEESILLSMISECALSLEAEKNRREREEAQIIVENERFRSKLLRSISHDLRTPLTAISGNAANLISHDSEIPAEEKRKIYSDIFEDSEWLIDLIENLLSITKLEENVGVHLTGEVVADMLQEAVSRAGRYEGGHPICLKPDEDCLIALMDINLILQVMNNLIGNAVKHTPAGTTITIRDWREDDRVVISVSDDGPGIPDDEKDHVFDLFYTGNQALDDSNRSLGLGLNLCRSILDAHGQTIRLEDNHPKGAAFIFTLQLWKGSDDVSISDSGC